MLKNLIQILHDGQEGFQKASENVQEVHLKEIFNRFSVQRGKFAQELESGLLSLGEEDSQNEGTTVAGALHRTWMDLKAALTSKDSHAVLSEAERGEDVAVKAYKDALDQDDLPAALHEVLVRQSAQVQKAHDEVKALRDATKAS